MSDMLELVVSDPRESLANLNDKLKHIGHSHSMPAAIASA